MPIAFFFPYSHAGSNKRSYLFDRGHVVSLRLFMVRFSRFAHIWDVSPSWAFSILRLIWLSSWPGCSCFLITWSYCSSSWLGLTFAYHIVPWWLPGVVNWSLGIRRYLSWGWLRGLIWMLLWDGRHLATLHLDPVHWLHVSVHGALNWWDCVWLWLIWVLSLIRSSSPTHLSVHLLLLPLHHLLLLILLATPHSF